MSRSVDDYQAQLTALQPPGRAFPSSLRSLWSRILGALAGEFARVDGRAENLIRESDPRAARELLPDWERVCDLPDPCTASNTSIQERRLAVVQRLTARGGQSVPYFESRAANLGYDATVRECRAFVCGLSQCGVQPLNPAEMRFVWFVALSTPRATYFRVASSQVGSDPLLKFSRAEDLECITQRLKPAHTTLFVSYTGV